ncbi:MAG: ATP-grasp domain-containing protein [Candidatus Odinarchaeum yellowstonii]|uniref:ATP-grasp domain-containing protein n=1 Tax=Odinarchaeota yellowstonii (strain LCB_4) TaxID=1841599 RepID=A0AAF0IBB1_ODILC|nr:MAG: ATP-grasp domain-containing protein [Candidatus Odinarchaeum yellowstonii]
MKILIIGYNTRPVAAAVKLLGHETYVIDYWGDLDIKPYADKLLVMKNKQEEKETNLYDKGLELFNKLVREKPDIDYTIICSGYDDEPEMWKLINERTPVLNVPVSELEKIRDRLKLTNKLEEKKIPHIKVEKATTLSEALKKAGKIGYPVLIRPLKSSGAYKLKTASTPCELEKLIEETPVYIEKYYSNVKVNLSQIVNTYESECTIISTNLQLLKEYSLGHQALLSYAGNITPYINQQITSRLTETTRKIIKNYRLKGIIGIDYIVTLNNQIYPTEINPRIPGSIDPAQITSSTNLLEHHFQVFLKDELPPPPKHKGYSTKIILKAKTRYEIPPLPENLPVSDITPPHRILEPGTPLCTVCTYDPYNPYNSYLDAKKIAKLIYLLNLRNRN